MTDPTVLLTLAAAGILALVIAATAVLKAWQGWLELKRSQLAPAPGQRGVPPRIELADLKDRVRRLEAIANGAEL